MDKSKNPYEKASQELNEFRERRVAERRSKPRGTPDRRRNASHEIQQLIYECLAEMRPVVTGIERWRHAIT